MEEKTPSYEGLTPEEAEIMLEEAKKKTKDTFTPIFIGKSNAVYVGDVKLEGVRTIEKTREYGGISTLCILFDSNKVIDMREKQSINKPILDNNEEAMIEKMLRELLR